MRETWTFHSAGTLVFGCNACRQIGAIAARWKAKRVLIVTDPVLVKQGLLDRIREPLVEVGIVTDQFTEGEPEPSIEAAEACIQKAREFAPDVLLGLGGGSNMDLAKTATTVLAQGGTVRDYVGDDKIPGPMMRLICVPTTAGTGSEVSGAAVLTDRKNQLKVGILSNYLRPSAAVVDPLLTVSCPPKVTADSGIDALTHAIEAYTAVDNAEFPLPHGERSAYQGRHPLGDCFAEKAIALIGAYLRRAVKNGNDLEAREGMALGATFAGFAFSNVGVALVHALEYPLGGLTHCSHGAGNGLLLPFVMRFNLSVRKKEFAAIARLLGEDVAGLDEKRAAERSIAAVERLRQDIGIPLRLRDLGVKPADIPLLAEKALGIRRIIRVNPRPVTSEDLEGILREAF